MSEIQNIKIDLEMILENQKLLLVRKSTVSKHRLIFKIWFQCCEYI